MEKPKLQAKHINLFALSNGILTIAQNVPVTYLTLFMTDYLGIDPVAIGTAMLIAKTVDFFVACVAGMIIEKVHMKHGKYVSWLRLTTATLFFGNIAQMIDTSGLIQSANVRLLIVCVFYIMFHCSMDFSVTARGAMIPKMAGANMTDRKRITSRQAQVGAAVSIIGSMVLLPSIRLVEKLTGSPSLGYFLVTLAFSVLFVIAQVFNLRQLSAFDPPEDDVDRKQTPTLKQMLQSVVTNKQMIVLFLGFSFVTIGNTLYSGLTSYYFRVTGNFSHMTIAMTARSICALLASMAVPVVAKKLDKKVSLIIGWTLSALGTLGIRLFALRADGSANLIAMDVCMCLVNAAMYMYTCYTTNYWLDCGEYGYYTTGKDNRTMALTVMNIPTKIGFALGGSLVGYMLAWAGYNAPLAGQAYGSFNNMGRFLTALSTIPVALKVVGIIIVGLGYKLSDKEAQMYAEENAKREAAARQA